MCNALLFLALLQTSNIYHSYNGFVGYFIKRLEKGSIPNLDLCILRRKWLSLICLAIG